MKEFIVLKREVHTVAVKIRAESREAAVTKVSEYKGDEYCTEYSHTLDADTWSVDEDGVTYYRNESTGMFDKSIARSEAPRDSATKEDTTKKEVESE
jgi:hypothetical protein